MATYVKLKLRRDTADNWRSANPLLSLGEAGVDLTNHKIKIGDGSSNWNALPYINDDIYDEIQRVINLVVGVTGSGALLDDVTSVANLSNRYPNPSTGDTAFVTSIGKYYRWNGSSWEPVENKGSGSSNPVANVSDLATTYPNATAGQMVFVTNIQKFYYYDGNVWKEHQAAANIAIVGTASALPSASQSKTGQLVLVSSENKIYYFNGSNWTPIVTTVEVPGGGSGGTSEGDGIQSVQNVSDLTTTFTDPKAGQLVYVVNAENYYYYNGSNWTPFSTGSESAIDTAIENKLKAFGPFGMGYTIKTYDQNYNPTFVEFEDSSYLQIEWLSIDQINKITASDGTVMTMTYDAAGHITGRQVTRPQ